MTSDACDADKYRTARPQFWVRRDDLRDGVIDRLEVGVDLREARPVEAAEERKAQPLRPVLFRGPILDESSSCNTQVIQMVQYLRFRGVRHQLQRGSHARQHCRIGPVGLRAHAKRLRKPLRLARVDLG